MKININSLKKNFNFLQFEILARKKLIKRYDKPLSFHDIKIINDIIYNEKTHFVELFKENLIFEDINEFLRRFYSISEINQKLKKILIFYEKFSKIYANYTILPESKYMYKNIKRKQKMIDLMQNLEEEEENESSNSNYTCIFTTNAMNSINSLTLSLKFKKIDDSLKSEKSIKKVINEIKFFENNNNKNSRKNIKNFKIQMKNQKISKFINNYNSNKNKKIIKKNDINNNKKKPLSPKISKEKIIKNLLSPKNNNNNIIKNNNNIENLKLNKKINYISTWDYFWFKFCVAIITCLSTTLDGYLLILIGYNKTILNKDWNLNENYLLFLEIFFHINGALGGIFSIPTCHYSNRIGLNYNFYLSLLTIPFLILLFYYDNYFNFLISTGIICFTNGHLYNIGTNLIINKFSANSRGSIFALIFFVINLVNFYFHILFINSMI